MKYETKSAIIGRKKRPSKDDIEYPCFVNLFSINDSHESGTVPEKMLDFPKVVEVEIKGLDCSYLLPGNDIIINNLDFIEIEESGNKLILTGKQS